MATTEAPTSALRTSRVIRALLGMTGRYEKDLAEHLGWSAPTMSKALKGRRSWKADEIEDVARFFDVPVGVLYEEPETLLERVRTGRFSALLPMVTPPQLELPFPVERTFSLVPEREPALA